MKFVLKEEKTEEDKLEFYLEEDDGEISLNFEDPSGDVWELCALTKEGKLYPGEDLPDDIGLDVDDDGRIFIEE